MYFEKEMWPILPDPEGARTYAGMSNVCEVVGCDNERRSVPIQIPSEFFSFAESVLRFPLKGARFYLDKVGDRWAFGVQESPGGDINDLWVYNKAPRWSL